MSHSNEIVERRLRPIYDSLEVGNNKKALQEAEKVLKKRPTLQCARALKALSMLRLGREDESQTIITALANENPCDDSTLQVMTYCYRETEQLTKICELYSNAAKMAPGNDELLSHLFMSYVRVNDFKAQQTVALQLYKLKPINPYYFWAVMSAVLQALRGPDSKNENKSKLFLALAQRMIEKLIVDDKLNAEQEVQLYVAILREQNKNKEALEFLNGAMGQKIYPGAPVQLKIELMKSINQWADLNKLLKELLVEHRDRWDFYKEYVHSCFELEKIKDTTDGADVNAEMCHDFLCQLIENGKVVRAPYLARLELYRMMRDAGSNPDNLLGSYSELLVEYFLLFGDKPCCANDLKLFLVHLEPCQRAGLASRLLQDCGISSTTLPQSKNQMQKHICSLQISRFCGAHAALESVEHLVALYTALSLHYEHGMSAFGNDLLPTDIGPSDPYGLLAVHVMYDIAYKTQRSDRLVESLCLLHYLLGNSPSNFHAKLLCLQIYHRLGCGLGAHRMYEELDIKHIQLDSLGYLHCAHLPGIGIPSLAKPVYDTTLKFFTISYKDSAEHLALLYKYGSFSKLQEFMDFRERLLNSLHYSTVSVEALLIELVCLNGNNTQNMLAFKSMNIDPHQDRICWTQLQDNRDITVIARWDPIYDYHNCLDQTKTESQSHSESESEPIQLTETSANTKATESFIQNAELLKMRATLLRLVAACIDLFLMPTDITNCPIMHNADRSCTLILLIESWNCLFVEMRKMCMEPISSEFLVNLIPTRIHSCLRMPYETLFRSVGNFVLGLWRGVECPRINGDLVIGEIKQVAQMMCDTISEHNQSSDLIWMRKNVQQTIVNCTEILSLCTFIFVVCYERLSSPGGQQSHTKNRKKKDLAESSSLTSVSPSQGHVTLIPEKERLAVLTDILNCLKSQLIRCDESLESWKCPIVPSDLTESLAAMSLNIKVDLVVSNTFRDNHQLTVKELRTIIKDKLKMIGK